jgi:adenylate cyclase
MQHRLAAVAVADAVGYSRAMALNEQATHERCKRHLQDYFIPAIDDHRGHLIKTTGDGLLTHFPSVLDAVNWAVEVQEKIYRKNTNLPQGEQLVFRIGIDMGDLIFDDEDVYGDEVNTATRIEKLAEPGGVCMSAQVYHSVHRKLPLEFEFLGKQVIKSFSEPVSVFRVKGRKNLELSEDLENDSSTAAGSASAFKASLRPSILVSPFQNMDQDPHQQYFCDGLTNDVTIELSKFHSLHVLSAHTAFASCKDQSTPQQLNRSLGVRYLLEGSVHRQSDRVRVNAHLIDAAGDFHLWAERYERPNSELFDIYDKIIEQIVATLASRIESVEVQQAIRKDPTKFNAYDTYLKGVFNYSIEIKERFESSRKFFRQATQLDPSFARAWGYLGYTTVRGVLLGWLDPAEINDAETYVYRAVEIDPADYANLWDLAFLHHNCRRFEQAEHEYSRAYALNPNDADLLAEMAEFFTFSGEHEKAIELFRKAMSINPHYPNWYLWNFGRALYHIGKYEQTIEELSHQLHQSSHSQLIKVAAYARLGNLDKARAIVSEVLHQDPHYTIEQLRWRDRFKNSTDEAHWLDALAMAGLP